MLKTQILLNWYGLYSVQFKWFGDYRGLRFYASASVGAFFILRKEVVIMKFCTKCGNQMANDMIFCSKCGAKNSFEEDISHAQEACNFQSKKLEVPKLRTSMKIWMIISFVFGGIFLIGCTADISMLAGVFLFGILGLMFLFLAKAPKESVKLFTKSKFFEKTQGISKGAFVGISIFWALFLFICIINTASTNVSEEANKTSVNTEEIQATDKPEVPIEFANECPISVSVSIYDNIIGFPELKCNIRNKTDKEISAIQLYFLPKDVYGEEADGIFAQNKLQYDTPISPAGKDTVTWQLLDQSVKSGDLYVYSVYFSDGTEWGNRNAPTSKIKKYAMQTQVSY